MEWCFVTFLMSKIFDWMCDANYLFLCRGMKSNLTNAVKVLEVEEVE